MGNLATMSVSAIAAAGDLLQQGLAESSSLEQAAQRYVQAIYTQFRDDIVLARLYATTPCSELPDDNQAFVSNLARQNGVKQLLRKETLVLSLLGTAGVEAAWNDRKKSRGHVGIPLVSAAFVDSIPMLSRLLGDLGVELQAFDANDSGVRKLLGAGDNRVFYVADASTTQDSRGRLVIPATDFVSEHRVKTVIGAGGPYPDGTIVSVLLFTRASIERTHAERLATLVSAFKSRTAKFVTSRRIFRAA